MVKAISSIISLVLLSANVMFSQISVADLTTTDLSLNSKTLLIPLAVKSDAQTFNLATESQKVMVATPSMAHTAFFCRIEDKLSRKSKLNVKVRLGDIRYTDYMEGKGDDPIHTPH